MVGSPKVDFIQTIGKQKSNQMRRSPGNITTMTVGILVALLGTLMLSFGLIWPMVGAVGTGLIVLGLVIAFIGRFVVPKDRE